MDSVKVNEDNNRLNENLFLALAVGIVSCNGGLRVCLTAQSSVFPNRERVQELSKMVENEFVEFCRKVGLEC